MRLFYVLYFFSAFVFLSSQATPNDDLIKASQAGNISGVNSALIAGANANHRDTIGMTPLMYAAKVGHEQIVALLLKAGADSNIRIEYGVSHLKASRTAFDMAKSESIKKLIHEHEKQKAAEEKQREKQRKAEAEQRNAEKKQNRDDRIALIHLRVELEPQFNWKTRTYKEIDNNKKIDLINEALKKVGPIVKPYLEKAIADPNNAMSYIGEAQNKNYSLL